MPHLVYLTPDTPNAPPGGVAELTGEVVTLGRDSVQNVICVPGHAVSRVTLRFTREPDGGYAVEFVRSRNGAWVNGAALTGRVRLADGDVLRVCDYRFQYRAGDAAEPRPSETAKPAAPTTWQRVTDGVPVVGFAERGPGDPHPNATCERDVAEFKARLAGLVAAGDVRAAVVDFTHYGMTDTDNGRAVVGAVLAAHKTLAARGGGVFVCHHPAQLDPDLQHLFKHDRHVNICRTLDDAVAAARQE